MDNQSNRKFWDRMARLYAPIQERSNRRLYQTIADRCQAYVTAEVRVLELACGSGQLTLPLWNRANRWVATDFSPEMIHEARRRCPAQITFSVQDATDLPYQDESFDLVLAANVLHIMPQPELALREIHRVLTSGGILLAPTFVYEGKMNLLRMRLTTLLGFRTYHQWTLLSLCEYLEAAGFHCLEAELIEGDPLPNGFIALQKQ